MFRFLAKSALATVIWKRYHRPIVATLSLLLGYFLVSMVHGDYVDYSRGAGDTAHLWLSYLIKWLALLGLTLLYYFYMRRVLAPAAKTAPQAKAQRREKASTPPPEQTEQATEQQDPFVQIRRKDKLTSRADLALNKHRQP